MPKSRKPKKNNTVRNILLVIVLVLVVVLGEYLAMAILTCSQLEMVLIR